MSLYIAVFDWFVEILYPGHFVSLFRFLPTTWLEKVASCTVEIRENVIDLGGRLFV